MEQLTDYQQAKTIVETLKKYKSVLITVQTVNNFRKYLKIDLHDKNKRFITRLVDGKVEVTRVK